MVSLRSAVVDDKSYTGQVVPFLKLAVLVYVGYAKSVVGKMGDPFGN